jgi:hypothetical protein
MPTFVCNHCNTAIKNNGGTAKEIGMFAVAEKYYCLECARVIIERALDAGGVY